MIISVQNNKGGIGKTSLVTNIASVLADDGKKILIIDTDSQGNVALSYGINPDSLDYTLYDILLGEISPKETLINISNNLDILPSNSDMDTFTIQVLTNIEKYGNPFYIMRDKLGSLAVEYDYIFIDSPPSLELIAGNIFSYADRILIPFQPESYSVHSLIRMERIISDFKENHNEKLEILGIVVTMFDKRTNLHKELISELKNYTDSKEIKVFDNYIPRSIRFASSVAYYNKPAVQTDKNNELVKSYYDLVKEIWS